MTYRIDTSMNDAPYQGIHIFNNEDTHVFTFHEDDAPVHDYNRAQRIRAEIIVLFMNGVTPADPMSVFMAFKHVTFIKPHERIKLEPKE